MTLKAGVISGLRPSTALHCVPVLKSVGHGDRRTLLSGPDGVDAGRAFLQELFIQ